MMLCRGCKAPIRNWRTVLDNLCGLCFAKAQDGLDGWRVKFDALLEGGMSRDDANVEIIRQMNAN